MSSFVLDLTCRMCRSLDLFTLPGFAGLARVTSDSKPFPPGGKLAICKACGGIQKLADRVWLDEIAAIYADYDVYHQSEEVDQLVIDPHSGALCRRGAVLASRLAEVPAFPSEGRWLDLGCGRGAMLQAVSNLRSGWDLYGYDLDDGQRRFLEAIDGFVALHCAADEPEATSFDVVSMVHSLEHFVSPLEILAETGARLAPSGWLFVEVNDTRLNPFDILVADHLTHFDPSTLSATLARAGFETILVTNDWVTKEISLVARFTGAAVPAAAGASQGIAEVTAGIQWLSDVAGAARAAAAKGPIGLFGSSIAATWLHSELGEDVAFFVDEDQSRVGRRHFGKPVLAPGEVEPGATVFIGLIPETAGRISERLGHLPIDFRLPPSLPPRQARVARPMTAMRREATEPS